MHLFECYIGNHVDWSAILPVVSAIIPKLDENPCDYPLIIHIIGRYCIDCFSKLPKGMLG